MAACRECARCLQPLSVFAASYLPCAHAFHPACVDLAREEAAAVAGVAACPVCLAPLPPPPAALFLEAQTLLRALPPPLEEEEAACAAALAPAVGLLRLAAGQGHAQAQFELGAILLLGGLASGSKDGAAAAGASDRADGKASLWFRRAAEQGHAGAMLELGCLFAKKAKDQARNHAKDSQGGSSGSSGARESDAADHAERWLRSADAHLKLDHEQVRRRQRGTDVVGEYRPALLVACELGLAHVACALLAVLGACSDSSSDRGRSHRSSAGGSSAGGLFLRGQGQRKGLRRSSPCLCAAAKGGHAGVVGLLLAADCEDVNGYDNGGDDHDDDADDEKNNAEGGYSGQGGHAGGSTALYLAAQEGHAAVVKLLLTFAPAALTAGRARAGVVVDVNKPERASGCTPLFVASARGHAACAVLLLSHPDVDVNKAELRDGCTPLLFACLTGKHPVVVDLLLRAKDIDVNVSMRGDGSTPLYLSCARGDVGLARRLLDARGVDVNATQRADGGTPVFAACEGGHAAVVELLLAYTPPWTLRGGRGGGGGACACDVRRSTTGDETTPLHAAASRGHAACVALLLSHRAAAAERGYARQPPGSGGGGGGSEGCGGAGGERLDVNAVDAAGCTPLLLAAFGGHDDVVELLLYEADVEVDRPMVDRPEGFRPEGFRPEGFRPEGFRPEGLAAASPEGHAAAGREARTGATPLLVAALEGHAPVVALLLAAGADRDATVARARDGEGGDGGGAGGGLIRAGLTALEVALAEGHADVADLLRE